MLYLVGGLGDGELTPGVDRHTAIATGAPHAGVVVVAQPAVGPAAVSDHVNFVII